MYSVEQYFEMIKKSIDRKKKVCDDGIATVFNSGYADQATLKSLKDLCKQNGWVFKTVIESGEHDNYEKFLIQYKKEGVMDFYLQPGDNYNYY